MRQQLRPWSALLLLASSHGLVLAALASPVNVVRAGRAVAADSDYGYWDITFTSSSAASGYRWEDVYANYSRAAGTTIHCHQLYNVTVGVTTRTCDDTSFGYDLTGGQGQQYITVHQNAKVEISGTATAIAIIGKGAITIECGKGVLGRSCEGSTRANATVVEGA